MDEGIQGVGLGPVHERKIRLVGDLQRAKLTPVTAHDGSDEFAPAALIEGVAQAAEGDVSQHSGLLVSISEGEDGVLTTGIHVDQVRPRHDAAAEVGESGVDAFVVVRGTDGEALWRAGGAEGIDAELEARPGHPIDVQPATARRSVSGP